jgi:multidrug efflux pump
MEHEKYSHSKVERNLAHHCNIATRWLLFCRYHFFQGFVGKLFVNWMCRVVLISAFVSLSLTPVLNIFLIRKGGHRHSWFYNFTEPFFVSLEKGYRATLQGFMRLRWFTFIIVLFCLGIIYFIGKGLPSELAPMEDRNRVRASVTGPEGADLILQTGSCDPQSCDSI